MLLCFPRTLGRAVLPLGAALLALSPSRARADIVPQLNDVHRISHGYTWSYQVDLTQDESLHNGNYFFIFPFAGFVPGTNFQPNNWVFAYTAFSQNSVLMQWTYAGSTIIGPGPVNLGLFGAMSLYNGKQSGLFAGQAYAYGPGKPGYGQMTPSVGTVYTPAASTSTIPEPGALSLLLPGLAPFALLMRKRARRN